MKYLLLLDARREARFRDGELVLLTGQDRSLWDAGQIAALYGELARLTDSPVVELVHDTAERRLAECAS